MATDCIPQVTFDFQGLRRPVGPAPVPAEPVRRMDDALDGPTIIPGRRTLIALPRRGMRLFRGRMESRRSRRTGWTSCSSRANASNGTRSTLIASCSLRWRASGGPRGPDGPR